LLSALIKLFYITAGLTITGKHQKVTIHDLMNALDEIISGKEVSVKTTKSLRLRNKKSRLILKCLFLRKQESIFPIIFLCNRFYLRPKLPAFMVLGRNMNWKLNFPLILIYRKIHVQIFFISIITLFFINAHARTSEPLNNINQVDSLLKSKQGKVLWLISGLHVCSLC